MRRYFLIVLLLAGCGGGVELPPEESVKSRTVVTEPTWSAWSEVRTFTTATIYVPPPDPEPIPDPEPVPPPPDPVKHGKGWGKGGKK